MDTIPTISSILGGKPNSACVNDCRKETELSKKCRFEVCVASPVSGQQRLEVGILCIIGSRTFVPISWMCKKTTCSVTQLHRVRGGILGRGFRMDDIPAPDVWDLVIEVPYSSPKRDLVLGVLVRKGCERDPKGRTKTEPRKKFV